MNDSRKAVIPCFSSLSRRLTVMTAIRHCSPGLAPGLFLALQRYANERRKPAIDNESMGSSYLWVKAFHIVFVAAWFAGLFYLPRLFVNLADVPTHSHAERERLLQMARRLYRFSSLLMLPALALGLWLWLGYPIWRGTGQYWLHAKLLLVLLTLAYHFYCRALLRGFEQLGNRRSTRWYRVFNELTVLLFAATVVLVVLKPF
jgi:putative membrane protein